MSKRNTASPSFPSLTSFITWLRTRKQWTKKTPKEGNHIRVKRWDTFTPYYNHGIYISDNEVIHFSTKEIGTKQMLVKTDLIEFLNGGDVEIRIYSKKDELQLKKTADIIESARNRIGEISSQMFKTDIGIDFANDCTFKRK
ncbi:MAG: lecithin retinol acyltransferase family protein [Candidatus Cloacimonadales bacterium]|jgi:hypothetical protein|nr:lecithin retinol acyltransferase family protein [Candidatus Cloacimonadota bacterium]MDD2650207.1 lecithin retinol acyltransferase family protein [Candidatus Cloacimonadota bacterium]MDD3501197.1 lecithin retinol acyltransferase family protein [Candidatus Cloacimonadota bacterium]MDX9977149.1 lecithin retinol acyltransferase family protein [Candidatus Cloacimonadales bacterium]